jgi:sec-independent protein translocase protein TatA
MPTLGVPELLIILVIVVVLFGASRLAGIGTALGSSIREFKRAVRDDDVAEPKPEQAEKSERQA